TTPLNSVGRTMDPRSYPKPVIPTEEQFNQFLNLYPSVAEQFENATAVRPWVSTERLQYSSRKTVGHRYCLMSHASGFVDPLVSRGMFNTGEIIQALVDPLLEALSTDNSDDDTSQTVTERPQRASTYST